MSMSLFTLMVLNKRFERNKRLTENEWSTTKLKKLDRYFFNPFFDLLL